MSLRLKPEALANFLKSSLHLPSPDKPRGYPLGVGFEVGAKESLGLELILRVMNQYPPQGHGGQPRTMPDGGIRDDLHRTGCVAVPVGYRDGPPEGVRVFSDDREVG